MFSEYLAFKHSSTIPHLPQLLILEYIGYFGASGFLIFLFSISAILLGDVIALKKQELPKRSLGALNLQPFPAKVDSAEGPSSSILGFFRLSRRPQKDGSRGWHQGLKIPKILQPEEQEILAEMELRMCV